MNLPASWRDARAAALTVLGDGRPLRLRANDLDTAADLTAAAAADHDSGTTARAWRGYSAALSALAHVAKWDAATIAAEVDSDRHLRAARRVAQLAAEQLTTEHPAHAQIAAVLADLEVAASTGDGETAAAALAHAALPSPLITAEAPPRLRESMVANADTPIPRAVCLVSLDGIPLVAPAVVRVGAVHALTLTARVLDWPPDKPELVLRPITVWPPSAAEATEVRLARPAETTHGTWEAEGVSRVVLNAADASGQPLTFTITAELLGAEQQPIPVLGYESFALRPYDPILDVVTGVPVVDGRLRELFDEVRSGVPDDELAAFARLMSATCRAAVRIQADNIFRNGTKVPEESFQSEMQTRLGMAPELEGRLRRTQQAGGITDLVHDDIVLELKVENERTVTPEVASLRIGQPLQYASGAGKQLSMLCILDMSEKDTPVGVLANFLYLLRPAAQDVEHTAHQSWVGVVVIGGNLPVPSEWSGRAIPAIKS